MNSGIGSSGEEGAVFHIPQRCNAIAGDVLTDTGSGIYQMHTVCLIIHDISHVVNGIHGAGDHCGIHDRPAGPCGILLHIPFIEHGIAVSIHQRALKRDLQSLNVDLAACADVRIQLGGGGDGGGADVDSRNLAIGVDRCNGFIVGAPNHITVDGIPGQNRRAQEVTGALQQRNGIIKKQNAGNGVGGLSPRTLCGSQIRNQQRGQLIPQVIVLVILATDGINLIVVRVAIAIVCRDVVGSPAQKFSVGIILHGLDVARLNPNILNQQPGIVQGIQGKGINRAGVIGIAVEGAIGITGQGIAGNTQLTNHRNIAGELVYGNQQIIVSQAVDLTVSFVVGHIIDIAAQVFDDGYIRQIVLGHDMEVANICNSKNILVSNGAGVVNVIAGHIRRKSIKAADGVPAEGGPVVKVQIKGDHFR